MQRSDAKAQRTFAKTHDSAAQTYGDEERTNRVAYAALKHTHEKVGDHWEPKEEKGPSDAQAAGGRDTSRLDVSGRSTMNKDELVDAIGKANDRETRRARENES